MGCGPYRVTAYRANEWATLEPVGPGEPLMVRFQTPEATESDMQKGTVDAAYAEPARQPIFASMGGVRVVKYPYWEMITVALNNPPGTPTGDFGVLREAILLAVDSGRIRSDVAAPATGDKAAGVGTGPAGGRLFVGTQDALNAPISTTGPPHSTQTVRTPCWTKRSSFRATTVTVVWPTAGRSNSTWSAISRFPNTGRSAGASPRTSSESYILRRPNPRLFDGDSDMKKFLAHSTEWSLFVAEWPYHRAPTIRASPVPCLPTQSRAAPTARARTSPA